jgi:hypothetical protein
MESSEFVDLCKTSRRNHNISALSGITSSLGLEYDALMLQLKWKQICQRLIIISLSCTCERHLISIKCLRTSTLKVYDFIKTDKVSNKTIFAEGVFAFTY